MNSAPSDAASLLASLENPQDFRGLYLRFSSFFRPFGDFVSLDDYNPNTVKKKTGRRKKLKQPPSKEKFHPIAKQFHHFICEVLKLLPELLKRSRSEKEEGIQEERAVELLGIYRLTIHCLLCMVPCLTGKPYSVHLQWGQLVRRLENWDKFRDAEEEGYDLLESLCSMLLTTQPHLMPSRIFIPDPSVVGSAGEDPQLGCLFSEVVIVLVYCTFKSKSRDRGAYERVLALAELVRPWFRMMESKAMASRHTILVDALYRCALFLASECKSLDDDLVQSFCLRMLKECAESPSADRFAVMAHRICSAIDVKWDRRSSLVIDMLRMSTENHIYENKVSVAQYVDELLGFVSKCIEDFYSIGMDASKVISEMPLELAGYLHQASIALKLCCKTIWIHINLLCQSQSGKSKSIQDGDESKYLIKDVIKDAFTKSARIIDILHRFGATNARETVVKSMFELSAVEISFPNLSLSFPLVKQWVKMLCKDFKNVCEVDSAPFLYSLLLCHNPTLPKKVLGEILEQELLAYDQLKEWNPVLCQKMQMKIFDSLLMDVFTSIDLSLQRARILVGKAVALRTHGRENLSCCFYCLTEAISLLDNETYDLSEGNTLGYHQLALAYLLRAQFAQETKQDWGSIQYDIHCAINLLSKLDFGALHSLNTHLKLRTKTTISLLCNILDLMSLKGFLKFHFDMHTVINIFCKLEGFSVDKCLAMLWTGRRLGHSLCTSPIDPDLVSKISQHPDDNINSIAFWINCLKGSSYFLLMFIQKLFLSDSVLNEENILTIESLYSCKLAEKDVKMVASSLSDVSSKHEKAFIAGQISYDLAERLFARGRVLEALSYAKEALNLRYKVLRKKFIVSSYKKPAELSESSIAAKGEFDLLYIEMLGSAINELWQNINNLEHCILSPWSILSCYLESILQVGNLYEATGDGVQAEKLLLTGKRLSNLQCLPIFEIAFTCALGQLYCKKMLWNIAEDELNMASKLLQEHDTMISCMHCKLALEVTIDMQLIDLSMKRSKRGSHNQSHALHMCRLALRKLSDNKVENSSIVSLKIESIGKSLSCDICSFLRHNLDARDDGQLITVKDTVVPLDRECGKSHGQMAIKRKPRNTLQHLSKEGNFNTEMKPRRSSRNLSFHNKQISTSAQNENNGGLPNSDLDVDTNCFSKSVIKENACSSFDLGCFNGDICPKIECLRCLCMKTIQEGTIKNIIYFKWQCQRRRLLLRLLLKMAKSLQAPGEKHEAHEVHGVFWQCISVMFDGRPCFSSDSRTYASNLVKLIGDDNLGEIFSVERAALLYNMSWFFLKNLHPESRSTKCCSLSDVQMQDVISWLLRAFILCREIPILFQKVSQLIASLILLSTVDGSLPPPLFSQESLSLSQWAAFFHQASIGTVIDSQYFSLMRRKACRLQSDKDSKSEIMVETAAQGPDIRRYTPDKLENLEEFVKDFFHGLPRISIVCISLLGGDYVNLLGEVLILTSFFPAWLLITRFDASSQPIIVFLPADSISEDIQLNANSCKEFVLENKVSVSKWPCPWNIALIDEVAPSYRLILEENFTSLSNNDHSEADARLNYKKWWSSRKILDNQLNSLLKTMEDRWIGHWGCLLLGERFDAECLETISARLSNYLNSQCDFRVNDKLIKLILSGAQSVVAAEACVSQSLQYRGHFGRGGCCGEKRFRAFADHNKGVKCMLTCIQSIVLEAISKGVPVDRKPVILVLDSNVQMLSWENMPILKNQEIYRMPSVGSILLKLSWSHHYHEKRNTFEVDLPSIDPYCAYYLLNPSGDLNYTQEQFEEWFQNHKWEGKVGNIPKIEELLQALQNHDLYLYFGHGSGMQYIHADSFGNLHRCAAAFLMGCSSGSLKQSGSYAAQGAPLHYLFAGSPFVIAILWEVSDKDIDRFAKAMLNSWTQDSTLLSCCNKCSNLAEDFGSMNLTNEGKVMPSGRERACKDETIAKETCTHCNAKLRVASFISQSRVACKLPTIIGASVVCYGVPTILMRKH